MARAPPSLVACRRLLLLGRAFARQAGQRQIGHDARARMPAGVDDGLVGPAEHPLHGFEIDSLPRHVRRLLVLFVDLAEARGLALGFGDGLFAIGLGILNDLGGRRLQHTLVGRAATWPLSRARAAADQANRQEGRCEKGGFGRS